MVDGERGVLVIGGFRVEELAGWRFEETAALLGVPLECGGSAAA
ncbi:MAG TPA: hypothetical protein VEU30_13365, partial [Thermoanaerobaculia bacterium]|nr:hypothetical protein [Thermoanaerobaculia bacterium]